MEEQKQIVFSLHAQIRMTQRGATEDEIRKLLKRINGWKQNAVNGKQSLIFAFHKTCRNRFLEKP